MSGEASSLLQQTRDPAGIGGVGTLTQVTGGGGEVGQKVLDVTFYAAIC